MISFSPPVEFVNLQRRYLLQDPPAADKFGLDGVRRYWRSTLLPQRCDRAAEPTKPNSHAILNSSSPHHHFSGRSRGRSQRTVPSGAVTLMLRNRPEEFEK